MDHSTPPYRFERRGDVPVMVWPLFDGFALDALVTTRDGGVSTGPYATLNLSLHLDDDHMAVIENRRRAAATVGMDLDDLVFCRQSHDRNVVQVTSQDRGRGARHHDGAIPDTDAMVTTDRDVGLVVMMADCVPIVLFCPETRVLGCVHAGWRGTTRRVVDATVATMIRAGARARSIRAALGPAVPAERYQVGADVLAATEEAFGEDAGALIVPDGSGRWRFDLWAANRVALRSCGIDDRHVAVADVGTGDGTPFFSDRAVRPCGRFAAIARITDASW